MIASFNHIGEFKFELFRNGQLIATRKAKNAVVTEGKNHGLDVIFGGATQVDPWYIGLINNSPTPTLLAADTLASHSGWSEFSSYTGNRKAYDEGTPSAGVIASSTTSDFTISTGATLYGCFICSVDTGTSGTLFATGAFTDGNLTVVASDVVKVSYTVTWS